MNIEHRLSFSAKYESYLNEDFSQNPHLRDHDPKKHLRSVSTQEYRVRSPKTALGILRFLLAKAWYEPSEGYSEWEIYLLIEAYDHILRTKDNGFLESHLFKLKGVIKLFHFFTSKLKEAPMFPQVDPRKQFPYNLKYLRFCFKESIGRFDIQEVLMTAHAYFGRKETFSVKQFLKKRLLFPRYQRKYQKVSLGVGYRDKGNMKDPAFDGSPSWQEVLAAPVYPQLYPECLDERHRRMFWLNLIMPGRYPLKT